MRVHRICAACALIGTILPGPGCSAPARAEEMVPVAATVTGRHAKSVSVTGEGGSETSEFWGHSQIGTEEFVQAVAQSLRVFGVFASVVRGEDADYHLHVVLVEAGNESDGFDITSRVKAKWTLTDRGGSKVLDETIGGEGAAGLGDAFVGTKRMQIVQERAARANIKAGVERLSKLGL